MTAEEYCKKEKELGFDTNQEAKEDFLDTFLFKNVNILIAPRHEYYEGETKLKYRCMKVIPRNIVRENKSLLHRLDLFEKMDDMDTQ